MRHLVPLAALLLLACGPVDQNGNGTGNGNGDPNGLEDPPRIVFQHRATTTWHLHTVALDGEDLTPLDPSANGTAPTAAAGTIVFVSTREGAPALYVIPAGGGEATRITDAPGEHSQPELSADGARLAYVRIDGGIPKVFVSAADGTGAERLTTDLGTAGTVEADPSFSPDASRIVLSATPGATPDLFIVDVATGEATPLLTGAATHLEPAWSPDGRTVAFAANIDGPGLDLYLVDVETGDVRRLTERDRTDAQPAWLPDGRLVYTAATDDGTELRWLDPDDPDDVHTLPTGPGDARNAAALR
jgi:TolB protein